MCFTLHGIRSGLSNKVRTLYSIEVNTKAVFFLDPVSNSSEFYKANCCPVELCAYPGHKKHSSCDIYALRRTPVCYLVRSQPEFRKLRQSCYSSDEVTPAC